MNDYLLFCDGSMHSLFSLQEILTPDVLYDEVVEVDERIVLQQSKCEINKKCDIVTGTTGEQVSGNAPIIDIEM